MNILRINNGKVEIRDDRGNLKRAIGNGDAVSARWYGKDMRQPQQKEKLKSELRQVL